nr:NAD(P)/FAD-dependent oxidoreductase [Streptomyces capitiformicae]
MFAEQREIHDYLRTTVRRHGIGPSLRHGVDVREARWDDRERRWHLETNDGPYSAPVLVLATGPWRRPRWPEVPGLTEFDGPVVHTARWDPSVRLTGRRIAVIGSGASAVQVVPAIQERAADVHVFQRTAHWLLPKPDHGIPGWLRAPGAQRVLRAAQYRVQEGLGYAFRHPRLVRPVEAAARAHLRRAVRDPGLRRALTPDYRLGCKRLLTSSTYYPALSRPHVRLHPTALAEVDGNRVIGADGSEAEADVIVLATGFHVGELPLARNVHGTHGRTLRDTWDGDGPQAYLGTSVSGFPNLFLLLGPNVLTGSTSTVTVVEGQLAHLTAALAHLRTAGKASLDLRPAVQARFNAAVQEALSTTVYNSGGCSSYYFSPSGRNTFCWPWSTGQLLHHLNHFDPDAYTWTAPGPTPACPVNEEEITA